ncbi:MAG TPA: hypothetical protein VM286_05595 [Candidatus Thermoplasmatota archaeon]|nr:hypothetical protein [Candidatus Thermoplasmatota archaeon]
MRLAPALAMMALLLSGCARPEVAPAARGLAPCDEHVPGDAPGDDWSTETIAWQVSSEGPFTLRVPLPVAPLATTPARWLANLTLPQGWHGSLVALSNGTALELEGLGNGAAFSCSVQPSRGGNGCCAEAYMHARWSVGEHEGALAVGVVAGSPVLEVHYAGQSRWGRSTWDIAPAALHQGWQDVTAVHGGYIE